MDYITESILNLYLIFKNRDLDFINILSYDYHSSFEPQVNHHAPLRPRSNFEDSFDPNEELNIVSSTPFIIT